MQIFEEKKLSSTSTTQGRKTFSRTGRSALRPHNNQKDERNMHSFRKTLHNNDGLKKPNVKSLGIGASAKTSQRIEKENQPTPGSAQALRRSLRASISSQQTNHGAKATTTTSNATAIGRRLGASLGPPQRVAPKTPNSLLRTELSDDDLEESLLVSPPGALWNVLDTSSTGLVVLSPQAAEHLNNEWSAQKQRATVQRDAFFSPPKPRTLLSAQTPVADAITPKRITSAQESHENRLENQYNSNMKQKVPEDSAMATFTPKGVCMDMTSMFSDSKQAPSVTILSPPTRLMNRLGTKKTPKNENNSATKSPGNVSNQWPLSLNTAREGRTLKEPKRYTNKKPVLPSKPATTQLAVPAATTIPGQDNDAIVDDVTARTSIETENGESSELGKMPTSSHAKVTATPPPHLAARLNRPTKSSILARQEVPSASSSQPSSVEHAPVSLDTPKNKGPPPAASIASVTKLSENGASIDMTDAFSNQPTTLKSQATPPAHLIARLTRSTRENASSRLEKPKTAALKSIDSKWKATGRVSSKKAQKDNVATKSAAKTVNEKAASKLRSKANPSSNLASRLSRPSNTATKQPHKAETNLGTSKTMLAKKSSLRIQTNGKAATQTKILSPTASVMNNQKLSIGKPMRVTAKGTSKKSPGIRRAESKSNPAVEKQPNNSTSNPLHSPKAANRPPVMPLSNRKLQKPKGLVPGSSDKVNTPITKNSQLVRASSTTPAHTNARTPLTVTPRTSNSAAARRAAASTLGGSGSNWAEKQCGAFVAWLDFTLNPVDEEDDAKSVSAEDAKTRTNMRALLIHRQLAQVRFRASEIFHDEPMRKAKIIIHGEIFKGRLSIRTDRDLHADLGLRRQAINLLQSYTTPWLRLGLEVLYGESIEPDPSSSDVLPDHLTHVARMKSALRKFIVDRVLSDITILSKYTKGRCKVPSGKFEKQYNAEMRVLVLYRILVLVFFLDRLKMANILDKVPRLFGKGADVKSSKAVLLAICRDFLSSEGDFIKHLSRIGLTVGYKQEAVDELDYRVSNIATDLRDGVRLTRMTEILTDAPVKSLMTTLRVPAVSRLQKLHNVNVALRTLRDFGIMIPEDVIAHHIIDGHREMNLKLMWAVSAHCCLVKLLENDLVETEIANVIRSNHARRKINGLMMANLDQIAPRLPTSGVSDEEILKSLLMRWCQAVCGPFGLQITDFTDSFADGRALCLLVHYYHPSVIKRAEILPTSRCDSEDTAFDHAVLNERANALLASNRVAELGGIPKMVPISDTENPPDEKSMLLCLSFMCSRLMESSKEIFATILIQTCYRRYREKVLREKKISASRTIIRIWREFKANYFRVQRHQYAEAVAILECFVLSRKYQLRRLKEARLQSEREQTAALAIQAIFRGSQARRQFVQLKKVQRAAVKIQSIFKILVAKSELQVLFSRRESCTLIQKAWRGFIDQKQYIRTLLAVIDLQKSTRGFLIRRECNRQEHAALTIQKAWWDWVSYWEMQDAAVAIQNAWRSCLAREQASILARRRDAAISIQRVWRGHFQLTLYSVFLDNAILIQKVVRGAQSRKKVHSKRCTLAATTIQSAWRSFLVQVQFQIELLDIVSIQSLYRRRKATRERENRARSVAILQNAFRCALARRVYNDLFDAKQRDIQRAYAAITCQCAIRCWIARNTLNHRIQLHYCAVAIQTNWRRRLHQLAFWRALDAAIKLQAVSRGVIVRKTFRTQSLAAAMIQTRWRMFIWSVGRNDASKCIQRYWRGFCCKRQFGTSAAAAVRIQSAWRRHVVRETLHTQSLSAASIQAQWRMFVWSAGRHSASKCIQRYWRGFYCKRQFGISIVATMRIQTAWRGYLARDAIEKQHFAACMLQSNWRCYWAKLNYDLDVLEIVIAQTAARRYLAKKEAMHRRCCVITIQNAFRRYQAARYIQNLRYEQLEFAILEGAVTSVQTFIRKRQAQELRRRSLFAILACQSQWRRMQALSYFRATKFAAIGLQAAYRGQKQRRVNSHLSAMATRIQSRWKSFVLNVKYSLYIADVTIVQSVVRRHLGSRFARQKIHSIIMIQTFTRTWLACRQVTSVRDRVRTEKHAAIAIQSAFRARSARTSFRATRCSALILQKAVRRYFALTSYASTRSRIVIVQTIARRRQAAHNRATRKASIVAIQLAFRRWTACKIVRRLEEKRDERVSLNLAALKLQSCARRYLVWKTMNLLHQRATLIQVAFRTHFARRCYELDLMDIVLSQSVVRRWLTCILLQSKRKAAATIQKAARRKQAITLSVALRSEKLRKEAELCSATKIQCLWRGYVSRKFSQRAAAARKIQKTWRCFIVHVDYMIAILSAIAIQASARRFLTKRSIEAATRAVVKLQARARSRIQEKKRFDTIAAVKSIQSSVRAYLARKDFATKRKCATIIQKWARGHICRVDFAIANFAACEIQRIWRGYRRFIDFAILTMETIKIQAATRSFLAKRRVETLKRVAWAERQFLKKKANTIQRAFRSFIYRQKLERAAVIIQTVYREILRQRKLRKVKAGVIQLQSHARAVAVRRRRPKKLVVLASRVARANERSANDPKLRLGYRTRNALTILRTSKRLSELMAAVKTLEASTRLSFACCQVFTHVEAARTLLRLIAGCNRSVPHVELVHFTLLTLDNVAQHAKLLPSFADEKSAEIFLDMIAMFRDNDSILCLSVSLLGRIAGCNPAVMEICCAHEHLKRLKIAHQKLIPRARSRQVAKQSVRKLDKMKGKRETFDMQKTVKVLGKIIVALDKLPAKPAPGEKHFKF